MWSVTSPEETAVGLDRPVLVGDLSAADGYEMSGPIPNLGAEDVVAISSSDNFLGFKVGEVALSEADDLDCAG